jgi:hypothetical protein
MSQEDEAIADIQRLLALTWRPWGVIPLDANTITRTWSLDLGWLEPVEAETLLAKLIATGWLTAVSDGLRPTYELGDVPVQLGWFPRKRLLAEPPTCPSREPGDEPPDSEKSKKRTANEIESGAAEPASKPAEQARIDADSSTEPIERMTSTESIDIPALLQAISDATKLERQEVMRRAQRKRRALGAITVWMALVLVARELGLDAATLLSE